MPTGDSLTVFTVLASSSLACMIGALTAPAGWRAKLLWCLCAGFALASLLWLVPPIPSPFVQGAMAIVTAAITSGVWILLATVGVVALMVGRSRGDVAADLTVPVEPSTVTLPYFAVPPGIKSKWAPDTTFLDAMLYLYRQSKWGHGKDRSPQEIKERLLSGLQSGKVTSWGKGHPSEETLCQIQAVFWLDAEITLESNTVFSKEVNATAYDVQLCRAEMEAVWPAKEIEASPAPED